LADGESAAISAFVDLIAKVIQSRAFSTFLYNAFVKSWDVIVVGGGIIGLSLAIALRKRDARVLIVERGEPGREASHAAAGMLVDDPDETLPALQALASASAQMYPEFVHELREESGLRIDLRDEGTILLGTGEGPLPARLSQLEPNLHSRDRQTKFLKERSVDPRDLAAAALKAVKHRGVDIVSGSLVTGVTTDKGQATGITTDRANYLAPKVVNCAGAWSGQIPPHRFPTRPVKGQMLAVVGGPALKHTIRSPEVYIVPRSNGRMLIGSTVEEAGFDKRTDAATIQRLHDAALGLVPSLQEARVIEAWAGLRPGTPDNLPILGETCTAGYFVATGHFRDGILLAPVTAKIMARAISGEKPAHDISAFSPERFSDDAARAS
jgi:glycine oxidase